MVHRPFTLMALLALVLSLLSAAVWAQAPAVPDAGALRQQIEQQRMPALPPAVRPERAAPPPPEMRPRPGVRVTVQRFRFVGNVLLAEAQLARAVAGFVSRPLDFDGLQQAADAVSAAYREAGWIVRVYLPEQDITEGEVTLQVVEARFGGVRLKGEAPKRVLPSELEAYFQAHQATGEPLEARQLDRALLLVDDLPGISVAGTLVPGAQEGEVAVELQTAEEPLFQGEVGIDNTGSRATGSERLSVSAGLNSPGQRGERVSLNLLHTRGSDYGRIALTVPEGHTGRRLGVSASSMVYRVINGPATAGAVPITGRSSSLGLDWNVPWVRARMHNLYLNLQAEQKHFVTRDLQVRADYVSYSLRGGLSGNRFDDWGGGGANSASVQAHVGRLAEMNAHAQATTIKRNYRKLSYSVSRQQNLRENQSLFVSVTGQHADQVLDSSERFYIGGSANVRAFPASEHGGDQGQTVSVEWRWRALPKLVVTAFADAGRVVQLPQPSVPRQSLVLQGVGASASWQGPRGLSTQLTWARRTARNPQPTLTGADGDGTRVRDRLWLTASLPF